MTEYNQKLQRYKNGGLDKKKRLKIMIINIYIVQIPCEYVQMRNLTRLRDKPAVYDYVTRWEKTNLHIKLCKKIRKTEPTTQDKNKEKKKVIKAKQ